MIKFLLLYIHGMHIVKHFIVWWKTLTLLLIPDDPPPSGDTFLILSRRRKRFTEPGNRLGDLEQSGVYARLTYGIFCSAVKHELESLKQLVAEHQSLLSEQQTLLQDLLQQLEELNTAAAQVGPCFSCIVWAIPS